MYLSSTSQRRRLSTCRHGWISPLDIHESALSLVSIHHNPSRHDILTPPANSAFLLKAIQLVASLRNIRSMWGQRRVIMQYLSEAVFIRSERSLDLLQGVLVLLGFYHYHCLVHIQFNNLMQLAVSIVGDMDLNIDPVRQMRVRALGGECEELRERNTDERRAIVGVWYMSSNVALTFNKGQSDKCTKYHEQCLEELEKGHEYESDILLIQLVRIQHLTQRIVDCNNRDQLPDELPFIEPTEELSHTQLPQHRSPPSLREPLLQDTSLLDSVSRSLNTLTLSDPITHARLGACHSAIQTWFEHWLTIPVCFYFYMSQPLAAQLIYSMMMFSRWALLFSDHCRDIVNEQRIDVLHFLNTTATRFEAAKSEMSAAQGGVWKNGFWDLAAEKLSMKRIRIEKWWGGGREGWRRGNV
ncbi:hypothetical protein WAI453_007288 [Rhynchosporium graminicola]